VTCLEVVEVTFVVTINGLRFFLVSSGSRRYLYIAAGTKWLSWSHFGFWQSLHVLVMTLRSQILGPMTIKNKV